MRSLPSNPLRGRPSPHWPGITPAIDLRAAAHLEFVTGVEEIFDVQVVKGARCPALSGPYPNLDSAQPIWTVPQAAQAFQGS